MEKECLFCAIVEGKIDTKFEYENDSVDKLLFNVEPGGGQVIFHLHMHLLGGWDKKR